MGLVLTITGIVANVYIIVISTWLVAKYLDFRKYVNKYMDDIDKIIDEVLVIGPTDDNSNSEPVKTEPIYGVEPPWCNPMRYIGSV